MSGIQLNRFRTSGLMGVALAGVLFICGQARAVVIGYGAGPVSTPGSGSFSGLTQIADETSTVTAYDSSSVARYTATIESEVLADSNTGDVDFAYRLTSLSSPSSDAIHQISLVSFAGYTTDIDYVNSGNLAFSTVQRSPAIPLAGFGLTFDYNSPNTIPSGSSSDWILVKTNAPYFDNNGTLSTIDGATANFTTYEPAVPEPVSAGIMGVVATLVLARRPARSNGR